MKKIFFLVLLVCLSSTSAAVASTIDLSTWTAYPGGSWNVSSDGSNVLQTTNGDPTYFVSNDNYINTVFNGQFSVETASDDDFIGFVFGFNGTDDFLLFDWKQGTQYYSGYTANSGFTLSSVTGSVTFAELWGHTGDTIEVLASDYGTGWADNTIYNFSLDYTNSSILISINDAVIFDISGTFDTGKFGFYNLSQSYVRYSGFDESVSPNAVPEPSTFLLLGCGLAGLSFFSRKRKKTRRIQL